MVEGRALSVWEEMGRVGRESRYSVYICRRISYGRREIGKPFGCGEDDEDASVDSMDTEERIMLVGIDGGKGRISVLVSDILGFWVSINGKS